MKKLTDEEIQKIIEEGSSVETNGKDTDDLRTYKLLFEALREDPAGKLSVNFADRVASKAFVQAEKRQSRQFLLLQLLSIFVALPLSVLLLSFYQPDITQQLSTYLYEARWIISFSILMFVLIQLADHTLLRQKKSITGY